MRTLVTLLLSLVALLSVGTASAASKEECLDAHGRGQDLRDKGQLSRARQAFLTCAQSSCPNVVQSDCSRLGEEVSYLVPTVTFVARDASAVDLPATLVYVDDALVATRLDDGKSYEIDPGKHLLRFVHDTRETTLKAVINQGEKGRVLIATFAGPAMATRAGAPKATEADPEPRRSLLPLVVAGAGAAAAVTGGIMVGIGMGRVPSNCSVSTQECSGPANDPSLAEASSGVSFANVGLGVGITGALVLVGGIVWHVLQPTQTEPSRRGRLALPNAFVF